jgi:hypothetical protein
MARRIAALLLLRSALDANRFDPVGERARANTAFPEVFPRLAAAAALPVASVHGYGMGRRKPSLAAVVRLAHALETTCVFVCPV